MRVASLATQIPTAFTARSDQSSVPRASRRRPDASQSGDRRSRRLSSARGSAPPEASFLGESDALGRFPSHFPAHVGNRWNFLDGSTSG